MYVAGFVAPVRPTPLWVYNLICICMFVCYVCMYVCMCVYVCTSSVTLATSSLPINPTSLPGRDPFGEGARWPVDGNHIYNIFSAQRH